MRVGSADDEAQCMVTASSSSGGLEGIDLVLNRNGTFHTRS